MEKKYDEKCFPHRWSSSLPYTHTASGRKLSLPIQKQQRLGWLSLCSGRLQQLGGSRGKPFLIQQALSTRPSPTITSYQSRVCRARVRGIQRPGSGCWYHCVRYPQLTTDTLSRFLSCILFHHQHAKARARTLKSARREKQTGQRNYTEKEHSTGVVVAAIGLCRFCREFEYPSEGG